MEGGQEQPNRPEEQDAVADDGRTQSAPARRFGASRILPRVEFGAPSAQPPVGTGEPISGPGPEPPDADHLRPALGAPREFAGGRVRLYGCSPGCLITALVVSVILSCLLTALVNGL